MREGSYESFTCQVGYSLGNRFSKDVKIRNFYGTSRFDGVTNDTDDALTEIEEVEDNSTDTIFDITDITYKETQSR